MPPERSGDSSSSGGAGGSGEGREVIFEFAPVGNSVKVMAVDVATGLEVSVIGPSTAAQSELERVALRKLRYMLEKSKDGGKGSKDDPGPAKGGGIVI